MDKTIKGISQECGVSEQAIRGWCRRNHVAKDAKGSFAISETVKTAILRHYSGVTTKDVAKDAKAKRETCESIDFGVISLLREELEQKNRQIEKLMEELAEERRHSREQSDQIARLADQAQKLQLVQLQPDPPLESENPITVARDMERQSWWRCLWNKK